MADGGGGRAGVVAAVVTPWRAVARSSRSSSLVALGVVAHVDAPFRLSCGRPLSARDEPGAARATGPGDCPGVRAP